MKRRRNSRRQRFFQFRPPYHFFALSKRLLLQQTSHQSVSLYSWMCSEGISPHGSTRSTAYSVGMGENISWKLSSSEIRRRPIWETAVRIWLLAIYLHDKFYLRYRESQNTHQFMNSFSQTIFIFTTFPSPHPHSHRSRIGEGDRLRRNKTGDRRMAKAETYGICRAGYDWARFLQTLPF